MPPHLGKNNRGGWGNGSQPRTSLITVLVIAGLIILFCAYKGWLA